MNDLVDQFGRQLQSISVASSITTPIKNYVIAYSGGMDSHVLLHLCKQSIVAGNISSRISFRAIHINHGLQQEAESWSLHCAKVCEEINIPFTNIYVDAKASKGEGPENAARKARYDALVSELEANECLLTAHHKDDQAETLLLQLFRGAGPAGLSSMPVVRPAGKGVHARPLLDFSRDAIVQYAKANKLSWVEDPSNQNVEFDRNLVRRKILPLIKERWQQVDNSLAQVASQQQDTLSIIEAMAAIDLTSIVTQTPEIISITALQQLSQARQLNVLRYWMRQFGKDSPTGNVLQQVVESVLTAADDAEPVVSWGQSEVRRYQNELYLLEKRQHDDSRDMQWRPREKLAIEDLGLELSTVMVDSGGLSLEFMDKELKVCFRHGGEKIQPVGREHTHSLKKLMQEAGIPPWERSRIPLIYFDDGLMCVSGYWIDKRYAFKEGEQGWVPVLTEI